MSITIRKYSKSDAQAMLALYHDTVHSTNAKDYSAEQIAAWVPSPTEGIDAWKERLANEKTLVAESGGVIAGFGNLHGKEIGMLYVKKEFQGKGVGAALLKKLEKKLKKKDIRATSAEVSITARPFFEKQGYQWVRDNRKMFNGLEFLNFIMEKKFREKGRKKKKLKLKKTGWLEWLRRNLL